MLCPNEDELAAFVDGKPNDDIELHLDVCASCRRVISALVGDESYVHSTEPGTLRSHQPKAACYGRFRLSHKLGQGGMGQVWAARDPQLGRDVAIKLTKLMPSLRDAEGIERMRREAQAMARLTHPNVVGIYELGTEGDELFCAMELIDGVTLREWLKTPRSWREVLDACLSVARGLQATHDAGLLHRDVKPDNVLIAKDGRALLTDFGLAKLASSETGDSEATHNLPIDPRLTDLTITGSLVGTPAYMAPEQLIASPLDARSDQFSFCITLFEALTGERPFRAKTLGQLVQALASGTEWPRGHRRIPRGVRKAILRGLAADRDERHVSMHELATALEGGARARRRRIAVSITLLLGTLGLVLLMTWPHQSPEEDIRSVARTKIAQAWNDDQRSAIRNAFIATEAPDAEVQSDAFERNIDDYAYRWLNARVDAWVASHIRGEETPQLLERRLHCYDRLAISLRVFIGLIKEIKSPEQMEQAVNATAKLREIESCADPLLIGYGPLEGDPRIADLEDRLAYVDALAATQQNTEALAEAKVIVAETEALAVPALTARALFKLALHQGDSSHPGDAETTFLRTIQEAAKAQDHALVARTWHRLIALLASHLGRVNDAIALEPAARAAIAQAGGDVMQYGMLDLSLGGLHYTNGRLEEAERYLRRARAEFAQARGPQHVSQVVVLTELGGLLTSKGQLDEADTMLREALAMAPDLLGKKSIDYGLILHNLAALSKKRKKWDDVGTYARNSIEASSATSGPESPYIGASRILLADFFIEKSDFEAATEQLVLAERAFQSLPPESAHLPRVMFRRANVAERQKHYGEAIELATEALKILRANLRPGHPLIYYGLAENARMLSYEHPADSLPLYDEALKLFTANPERDRSYEPETLEEVAQAALRAGKPQIALKWFDRLPESAASLGELRAKLLTASHRSR